MVLYYFDASALVKYYVTEPGSTWVREVIDARDSESDRSLHIILVAEITRVEVAAGLAGIERGNRIRRPERDRAYHRFISQLTHRYSIVALVQDDFATAAHLTQHHPLRAYDAVQLAVALRCRQVMANYQEPVIFVSGDNPLIAAAQAEAFSTDNPFEHISSSDETGRSV